jgi:hypothetical protein
MLIFIIDIRTKESGNKYRSFLYTEPGVHISTGLRKSVGCPDIMFMHLIFQVMVIQRVVAIKP